MFYIITSKGEPEAGITKQDSLSGIRLLITPVEIEGHDADGDDDKNACTRNS
jgi:hypothetical protein